MPGTLREVEISHFKTYRGAKKIGPIEPYHHWLAIIGYNGSGKSNVMDAIAFALGERKKPLRCKNLDDLVYKDDKKNPVPGSNTYVTVTLESNDHKEKAFKRAIRNGHSEYSINGEVVQKETYINELKDLGLNIGSENFLVYQGLIDRIIDATPRQRTAIFEEKSRSIHHKAEYDRLKSELEKFGLIAKNLKDDQKLLKQTRYQLKHYLQENARMEISEKDYDKLKIEFFLFKIRTDELFMEDLTELINMERNAKEENENQKSAEKMNLQNLKREYQDLIDQIEVMKANKNELEEQLTDLKKELMEVSEEILISEKISARTKHMILSAKNRKERHEAVMAELEEQLKKITELRQNCLENYAPIQKMEFDEESEKEYQRLKGEVIKKSTAFAPVLEKGKYRKNSVNEKIQDENKRWKKIIDDIRMVEKDLDDFNKREINTNEFIRKLEENAREHERMRMEREIAISSQRNVKDLKIDLENIVTELEQIEVNFEWKKKAKRDQAIMNILRSEVHGVHDRIYNLCQPSHDRYAIAMTKAFGKNFSAIVVDNAQVAIECIGCLKSNRMEPQTFLPITSIKFWPLKKRLRNIKNAKLLYDVMNFPQYLENIILHAIGSTLVCETAEDANTIAYESWQYEGEPRRNLDTIALDGTHYRKNGIFSGGQVSIAAKATLLDTKRREELLSRKSDLMNQLRNIEKLSEMKFGLEEIEKAIRMNNKCLENAKHNLAEIHKEITEKQKSLKSLQAEKKYTETTLQRLQKDLEELNTMMNIEEKDIRENLIEIEDETFAEFCADRNIRNIREYEEYLELMEEKKNKLREIDTHYNRIQNQLNFETQRKSDDENLTKLRDKESELQLIIDELLLKKNEIMFKVENQETKLNDHKKNLEEKTVKLNKHKEKVEQSAKKLSDLAATISLLDKKLNQGRNQLTKKLAERHDLFKKAKMELINLPLKSGSMDVLFDNEDTEKTCDEIYEDESRLEFDFSLIPQDRQNVRCPVEFERYEKMYQNKLSELEAEISKIKITNAAPRIEDVDDKLKALNEKIRINNDNRKRISDEFDNVKCERSRCFLNFFNQVSERVDTIYKEITGNDSAQAVLMAFNQEEPYLDGIKFECVAPRKKFLPMQSLSGGERTMAALALLFALRAGCPPPFLIMDEIDAPLDEKHVHCLTNYLEKLKIKQQIILITLKSNVYKHADLLIGIHKESKQKGTDSPPRSKVWLLELNQYNNGSRPVEQS